MRLGVWPHQQPRVRARSLEVDGEEASSPVLARAEAALGAAGGAGAGGPGVMDRVLAAGAAALREVNADRIRAAWKRTLARLAVATAVTLVRVLGGIAPHLVACTTRVSLLIRVML